MAIGYDADAYVNTFYNTILPPDRAILEFLAGWHKGLSLPGGKCIEVGAGPNLFPLMAAAPYRSSIHVTDVFGEALAYTQQALATDELCHPWQQFYDKLTALHSDYAECAPITARLRDICQFERLSVFDLPQRTYHSASTHSVLEALSDDFDVLEEGCRTFLDCLMPGGSFVVSLMLDSRAYALDGHSYQQTPVSVEYAEHVLSRGAINVQSLHLTGPENMIREGHSGLAVITGKRPSN